MRQPPAGGKPSVGPEKPAVLARGAAGRGDAEAATVDERRAMVSAACAAVGRLPKITSPSPARSTRSSLLAKQEVSRSSPAPRPTRSAAAWQASSPVSGNGWPSTTRVGSRMIAGPKPRLASETASVPAAVSSLIRQSTRGCTLSRLCRRVAIAWRTVREMAQSEMQTGNRSRETSAQSFQRASLPGSLAPDAGIPRPAGQGRARTRRPGEDDRGSARGALPLFPSG